MHDVRDMEAEAARIAAMKPDERAKYDQQLLAHRMALGLEQSPAVRDILAERARQVTDENWTTEHDDEHRTSEMAFAAAAYAVSHAISWPLESNSLFRELWPWDRKWWKPKDRRRDCVRAAALLVAEIERLDRATAPLPRPQQ